MPAVRFILLGYGIAAIAGLFSGHFLGPLTGWLTAWLGGGSVSLLLAYRAFRTEVASDGSMYAAWDRDLSEELFAADLRAEMAAQEGQSSDARRRSA